MLSIAIPARNEPYLDKTIESILAAARGEIEIIAILDGYLPDKPLPVDPRIITIHHATPIGQRPAINEAARIVGGRFFMKCDAHCAFDEGFDVKLAADCERDWTVIPRQYQLDAETWQPKMKKKVDDIVGTNDCLEIHSMACYYNICFLEKNQ